MPSTTPQEPAPSPEGIRGVAIDHHHDFAAVFEQHYRDMSADRFSTAFTYGRAKVDQLLDEELKARAPGSKILDVGCGTGNYLVRFRDLGFEVQGVEPAPGMIEAAQRLDPTLPIVEGVATKLPFPDASFDVVTAIEVLRYLHREDVLVALREMTRVLRPGGTLFVTMVNRWALDGFYAHQRLRQRLKGRDFDRTNPHCEFTSPAELEADLRAAGLDEARTVGRLLGPMRLVYKLGNGVGSWLARRVEPYDDAVCSLPFTTPFSGHLIGIGKRAGSRT